MSSMIKDFIQHFHNVHRGRNWFGQSYQTKLQDLSPELRFERPRPGIHSVAELIAHGTAWRMDAIVKIKTGQGELTEANDLDWPDLDLLKETGWDTIYEQYVRSVDSFIRALEDKEDSFLQEFYSDPEFNGKFPYSFTTNGILQHDIYHLGQIGLVCKMLKSN